MGSVKRERIFEEDGWETRFRVGLLVPDGDVGPESEWSAIVPEGISFNTARFGFAVVPPEEGEFKISTSPVEYVVAPGPLDNAIKSLATTPLIDVFSLGFTSNSYVADDAELVERLSAATHGRPVVTTGQAFLAAIAQFDARKIMLVDPPWFPEDLTQRGREWLERSGVGVSLACAAGVPSGQDNIHPGSVYRWIRSNIPADTDMILVGGNGFRTAGIIRALEADAGIPVVTANTALLWHTLRTIGYPTNEVTRYGRIFAGVE